MLRLIAMVLAVSFLASCTAKVKAPEAEVKLPGGVEVEIGESKSHQTGKFCPPGQAKKGRC